MSWEHFVWFLAATGAGFLIGEVVGWVRLWLAHRHRAAVDDEVVVVVTVSRETAPEAPEAPQPHDPFTVAPGKPRTLHPAELAAARRLTREIEDWLAGRS